MADIFGNVTISHRYAMRTDEDTCKVDRIHRRYRRCVDGNRPPDLHRRTTECAAPAVPHRAHRRHAARRPYASDISIPAQWRVNSQVQWNYSDVSQPLRSFIRVESPDGSAWIEFFPIELF